MQKLNEDKERKSINVVLIGEVSSGKTTLLNSMFIKTFSDMKRIRTTMGVNIYYETNKRTLHNSPEEILQKNQTFETIMKDKKLETLAENIYYVSPSISFGSLLTNKGYSLNIIDIPGLNDGNGNDAIKKWLEENFKYFDIIFFIINGEYALNTESERNLLKFIISNMSKNKYIKLINIINKFDDPDDEELIELKDQAFKYLNETIKDINHETVAISAERAYLYRYIEYNKTLNGLSQKHKSSLASLELGTKSKKISDDKKLIAEILASIKESKKDPSSFYNNTGYRELIEIFKKNVIQKIDEVHKNRLYYDIYLKKYDAINDFKKILEDNNNIFMSYDTDIINDEYLITVIDKYLNNLKFVRLNDWNDCTKNFIMMIKKLININEIINKTKDIFKKYLYECIKINKSFLVWFNCVTNNELMVDNSIVEILNDFLKTIPNFDQIMDPNLSGIQIQSIINQLSVDSSTLIINFINYFMFCFKNQPCIQIKLYLNNEEKIYTINMNIFSLILNEEDDNIVRKIKNYFPEFYKYKYYIVPVQGMNDLAINLNYNQSVIDQLFPFLKFFIEYLDKSQKI